MKKISIVLFLIASALYGHSQSSDSKPIFSPLVVRMEMEKAGLKLSHNQYMKLQKCHQNYATKIGEANTSGEPTKAKQLGLDYVKELSTFLSSQQLEKYNKMLNDGFIKKSD